MQAWNGFLSHARLEKTCWVTAALALWLEGELEMAASKNDKQAKPSKDALRAGLIVEVRGAKPKEHKIPPFRPNRLRDGSKS